MQSFILSKLIVANMDQVLQFPSNSSSNIDIKIEQVETIKLENIEVKLEKLHNSIDIKNENLLKNHQFESNIGQVLQFPSNSSSNIVIKTEPVENIEVKTEGLHHSIDIKDETSICKAEEVGKYDSKICSQLTSQVQNTKEIGKRKKIVVSIEQKLKAFRRLDNGESIAKISSDLGVGRTTIKDWKKRRTELETWSNSQIDFRKIKKKCKYEKVNEALFLWFTQQRNKGMNIIGPILKEKALQFQREFNEGNQGEPTFSASDGWLHRWKKRYGIKLNLSGGKLPANECPSEYSQTIVEGNDSDNFINLVTNIPGCENMISDDEEELIKHDEQQELTVNDITTLVNGCDNKDKHDVTLLGRDKTKIISNSDGIKALDTALAYVKQQVGITSADIMLLQRLRNYAANKKNEESNR